jgi:hypothetical protein
MAKQKVKQHPAVKAWQKWLNSTEGQDCLLPGASGQYLENRLWKAFMAGTAVRRERGKG